MHARSQVHPSPQRTPVLFQAGASKSGISFAAKHAECIFVSGMTPASVGQQVRETREAAIAAGRDPNAVKCFTAFSPIIGRTAEEAQAKYDIAVQNADFMGGLAQTAAYLSIDLSKYPLDEPLRLDDSQSSKMIMGIMKVFTNTDEVWTPRRVGTEMALGGFHPKPVGTPEMVADCMERWVEEADVDGFLIAYVCNPGSFEDVVYLLRPELENRGLVGGDYDVPGGTFRENLYGKGQSRLRDDHYGSKFKHYGAEANGTKNGTAEADQEVVST